MLKELRISNFAIIDELEIIFKNGLTVLCGETGTGKSIIIDALDFLLGARGSNDLIKTGANKARVEGIFTSGAIHELSLSEWFEKNGFDLSENNIITISRELSKDGSRVRINGSLANVSHLLYLRGFLVDIHEQSGHIELLKNEKQLEILDNYGDGPHKKILDEYKKIYEEYEDLKTKLSHLKENQEAIAKKMGFLKFQADEIRSAKIKEQNEDNKLQTKREILQNKKELVENSSLLYEIINGEGQNNLLSILAQIKKSILNSSRHDKSFELYLESIESITSEIKDLSSFVKNYSENVDQDENTLGEIEERLDLFYNLKKKYGKTLQEVIESLHKIEDELSNITKEFHEIPLLEAQFKQKEKEVNNIAEKLTKSREKITRDFVNKINEELQTLGFKHAIFVVEFINCELSQNGKEQIQFLFSANPDEPPKLLLKVASGGELSRIMLAIKSIVCKGLINQTLTMLFDEIDMGTSGEIAANVARKLFRISRSNQVIYITHQPIIASMADNHFLIEKKVTNGNTRVILREVTQNEKAEALANLLTPEKQAESGISTDAKEFAKSLLENAKKIKEKELV